MMDSPGEEPWYNVMGYSAYIYQTPRVSHGKGYFKGYPQVRIFKLSCKIYER